MGISVSFLDYRRVRVTKTYKSAETLCRGLKSEVQKTRLTRLTAKNLPEAREKEMLDEENRLLDIIKKYDPSGEYSKKSKLDEQIERKEASRRMLTGEPETPEHNREESRSKQSRKMETPEQNRSKK